MTAPVLPIGNPGKTGSGMYHPIVKEQVIPGQLEGLRAIHNYSYGPLKCQAAFHRTQIKIPPPLWKSRVLWRTHQWPGKQIWGVTVLLEQNSLSVLCESPAIDSHTLGDALEHVRDRLMLRRYTILEKRHDVQDDLVKGWILIEALHSFQVGHDKVSNSHFQRNVGLEFSILAKVVRSRREPSRKSSSLAPRFLIRAEG